MGLPDEAQSEAHCDARWLAAAQVVAAPPAVRTYSGSPSEKTPHRPQISHPHTMRRPSAALWAVVLLAAVAEVRPALNHTRLARRLSGDTDMTDCTQDRPDLGWKGWTGAAYCGGGGAEEPDPLRSELSCSPFPVKRGDWQTAPIPVCSKPDDETMSERAQGGGEPGGRRRRRGAGSARFHGWPPARHLDARRPLRLPMLKRCSMGAPRRRHRRLRPPPAPPPVSAEEIPAFAGRGRMANAWFAHAWYDDPAHPERNDWSKNYWWAAAGAGAGVDAAAGGVLGLRAHVRLMCRCRRRCPSLPPSRPAPHFSTSCTSRPAPHALRPMPCAPPTIPAGCSTPATEAAP